jgi:mannosyl-oligosaccharide alpha-1,2-mannosidase
VFLVFAVFAVGLLYHSFNVQDWKEPRPGSVDGLIKYNQQTTAAITPATKDAVPDTTQRSTSIAAVSESSTSPSPSLPPVATTVPKVDDDATTTPTSTLQKTDPLLLATPLTQPTIAPIVSPLPTPKNIVGLPKAGDLLPGGEGRHEVPPPLKSASAIHWIRLPEHFPVPSESLIHLPTAKPSPIPKIQHAFTDETPSARSDRESKLTAIREAFRFSWTEYKSPNSWLHDELAPVSGGARDPFCGWAATLVDSLDTLWIMGMEDEFKSAAAAVGQIDFTTSIRNDIPLFETTIRYLGGLLSSYELSGAKYNVLLEKAVELASVLMGAFDTPNRMPITYYYWKP